MTPEEAALLLAVVEGIGKIVDTYRSSKTGATDPKAALDAITLIAKALTGNNAAADTALDAKFPK